MAFATATVIGLGLLGGATAVNAVGQYKAGKQQKKIAEFNAGIAEVQAKDAIERGAEDEHRFRQGVRILIGKQRAGFAGQGVDVGVGSAADVQADAAYLGELDALSIRNNAAREAWGYKVQAQNYRMGGQAAQSQARWAVGGTVLGGAAQGYSLLAAKYGWGER